MFALKEIQFSEKQINKIFKLKAEIEMLSSLRHMHIVEYIGTSMSDNTLSIFTEWIPGGNLASIVHKFGALEESTTSIYTRQLLLGLRYLHDQHVIHRDIKGANILLDTTGRIKLTDFGASERINDNEERIFEINGTPYYMSPEMMCYKPQIGYSSDIWSVGCTILEVYSLIKLDADRHSSMESSRNTHFPTINRVNE